MKDYLTDSHVSKNYTEVLTELIAQFEIQLPGATEYLDECRSVIANQTNNLPDHFKLFADAHQLNTRQQIVLAASLTPYSHPTLFYPLAAALAKERNNVLGFINDQDTGVMYPTIQTLLFAIYGADFENYLACSSELLSDFLFKAGVLQTHPLPNLVVKNNPLCHVVSIGDDYLPFFFTGAYAAPQFSSAFPAQKITTQLSWSDLVLDGATLQQVNEITLWHKHKEVVLHQWNLHKKLSAGYKVLFYGPPGTGKSLTAAMIGKELGIEVYRVDLSMVVSKYIGETEKNLSSLFDRAMDKDWILFFDEADALFGSRTDVQDSHDRYANQEVSYLLQRLESYQGIVILASNLKGNMDKAFSRRFQNMIKFKVPDAEQRKKLWTQSFSEATVFENDFPLNDLAKNYELAGGSIINVVQYATLKAAERGNNVILYQDVKAGVIRELGKDGKTP